MKIKLALNGGLGYYFCGSIALSIKTTVKDPLEVETDSLTDKEILGLARATRSGVIKVVEGEKELLEKAYHIASETKSKKLVKVLEQVVETPTEVVTETPVVEKEEQPVEVKTEAEPVVVEETPAEAEEVVEKKTTTTRAKRTSTVKK